MFLSTSIALTPDWTIIVQLGIFLATLAVVSRFLVKPLMHLRGVRREITIGAQEEARRLLTVAEEKVAEYERRIAAARQDGQGLKESLRQEGYAAASKVMDGARRSAFVKLDEAKARTAKEADGARKLLEADAEEFGRTIVERILERNAAVRKNSRSSRQGEVRGGPTQGSA